MYSIILYNIFKTLILIEKKEKGMFINYDKN